MKQTSCSTSVSLFIHGSVLTAFQVSLPDSSVLRWFFCLFVSISIWWIMDTVKSCISRRFLFCLVFSTFLHLHCPAHFPRINGQLGQQVSYLPSASTNYTLEYQRIKECEGSAFPGLLLQEEQKQGRSQKYQVYVVHTLFF